MPPPELQTHYVKLGDAADSVELCAITPIALTPEQLVNGLFLQKNIRLVAFGDSDHSSTAINRQLNDIRKTLPKPVTHSFVEVPSSQQSILQGFLDKHPGLSSRWIDLLNNPENDQAPKDPGPVRDDFYKELRRNYTISRDKDMKVHCIDDDGRPDLYLSVKIANEDIKSGYSSAVRLVKVLAALEKDGKMIDPATLSDEAFAKVKQKISAELKGDIAGICESKEQLQKFCADYLNYFGIDSKKLQGMPFKNVEDAIVASLEKKVATLDTATNERDEWRDKQMFDTLKADLAGGAGIAKVGQDHIARKNPSRKSSNLGDFLRQEYGAAFKRIDVVPVDPKVIQQYGRVFIGGREGADYTIFVPVTPEEAQSGQNPQLVAPSGQMPVKAMAGPHQKRIAELPTASNAGPDAQGMAIHPEQLFQLSANAAAGFVMGSVTHSK